jgi:NAD+ synthase (glutamine-hydrolysing)
MMPSIYSSGGSLSDGQELINNLSIQSQTISIQTILESYLQGGVIQKLTLAEENLQARIRGNILMGLSGREGGLVLATGNKSEFAVGYSTLYGDMCGALAPIGDLWKTQVWKLSGLFAEIPKQIIDKPPSAELKPNQLDIDSLPDYVLLDAILIDYIEYGLSAKEIEKKGFNISLVEKTIAMLHKAEFKRKQAPIILKISNVAFGSGWIQAIAKK